MDIISPNRYASVGIDMYNIDCDQITSYTTLKQQIQNIKDNIEKLKRTLHGLIVSRPVDIFTESDENGTVLDQIQNEEDSILCDLSECYSILEQLNIIDNTVANAYNIINRNSEFDSLSTDKKWDKAFKSVIYSQKDINSENARYYLHKSDAAKKYRNIIYNLQCNDRNIKDISDKVYDNIESYDYNDGRQLMSINNIFNKAPKDSKRTGYVIYINDNKDENHLFVNNSGQWLFNTEEEAKTQIADIIGVSYMDYFNYNYIKDHYSMFDEDNENGFIKLFDKLSNFNKFDNNYNPIDFIQEIVNNIYRLYYNTKEIDLFDCYAPITTSEAFKLRDYIKNKILTFVNNVYNGTLGYFSHIMTDYYNTMCKVTTISLPDEISDFKNCDRLLRLQDIENVLYNKTSDYVIFSTVISVILKHYLKSIYSIKKIDF